MQCSTVNRFVAKHCIPNCFKTECPCRTEDDELRRRDRYECALDNYPSVEESQTVALAETAARYMGAQIFAISAINISGSHLQSLKNINNSNINFLSCSLWLL